MKGKYVRLTAADGGRFSAYLSLPPSGRGPGIVLLQEIFGVSRHLRAVADLYAEEGYVVLVPDLFWRMEPGVDLGYSGVELEKAFAFYARFDVGLGVSDGIDALKALRALPECEGKAAALGYCLGGTLAYLMAARSDVECAICYYGVALERSLDEATNIKCPLLLHFAGADKFVPPSAVAQIRAAFAGRDDVEIYVYSQVDHAFNNAERPSYDKPAAMMAHSRSIALLRRVLGPRYDLSTLWEKHCEYEFATRDVDATMRTMIAQPYVNHIPTLTGGVGYEDLRRFYDRHFVPRTPKDTRLIPISRTVGADRIVDEMLFCFTHDIEIDWMLPGVAPTGRYVKIPLVAIINFRGDKLYHEHIYWDQASVLVQIGLLSREGLPVAGVESADKLLDENLPSNTLMRRWAESAPTT